MAHKTKKCDKHGVCKFYFRSDSKALRCSKCSMDAVNKRRRKVKQMGIDYKGGECSICGYSKSNGALEFHHTDPTKKDFGIAHKGYTMSWDKIKKELDKCVLLCCNCHREVHEELLENIGV
jgi:hypothetical protein